MILNLSKQLLQQQVAGATTDMPGIVLVLEIQWHLQSCRKRLKVGNDDKKKHQMVNIFDQDKNN